MIHSVTLVSHSVSILYLVNGWEYRGAVFYIGNGLKPFLENALVSFDMCKQKSSFLLRLRIRIRMLYKV